tara:strand:+ start:748 stop:1017 length:270 start_codon:yes stop_codon:yes gene_type:complete
MKETESYEQLLERFTKRTCQLQERLREIREEIVPGIMEEEGRLDLQLARLEGSIQAIEYLAYGKLPNDGNHDGMKDHKPIRHGTLDALD